MKQPVDKQLYFYCIKLRNCFSAVVFMLFLLGKATLSCAGHLTELQVGGGIHFHIDSYKPIGTGKDISIRLASHLPGFSSQISRRQSNDNPVSLTIKEPSAGQPLTLYKHDNSLELTIPWNDELPDDLLHLLYGISRVEWINKGTYPVHSACIGDDKDGYYLLVGASGAGKTSMTLHSVLNHNKQIYSTDKTLVRFEGETGLQAIAGTPSLTVRKEDEWRWTIPEDQQFFRHWDRKAFYLPEKYYTQQKTVPVKGIYFIRLSSEDGQSKQLSPLSALHTLYPFFLDRQREDILIGGSDALWDGAIARKQRLQLAKHLNALFSSLPVHQVSGPPEYIYRFIEQQSAQSQPVKQRLSEHECKPKKILYGVCGLGAGHSNRATSVIQHLLKQGHEVSVFTYGEGLKHFQKNNGFTGVNVIPVANPYYPSKEAGKGTGLDFAASAYSPKNQIDFHTINSLAMDEADRMIGKPDLVISDYEMNAARYAYVKQAPFVTLDHESIYSVGDYPEELNGYGYDDEIERLDLFFPKTQKRIITSFFSVPLKQGINHQDVIISSPIIRSNILQAKGRAKSQKPSLLIYVSNQKTNRYILNDWIETIDQNLPGAFHAHFFFPRDYPLPNNKKQLHFYHHGDVRFDDVLIAAHGVISTAGHTLLSEALYLDKPVYALPLSLYEQQHNASQIEAGQFGVVEQNLTKEGFQRFVRQLDKYEQNIKQDPKQILNLKLKTSVYHDIDKLLDNCSKY